MAGTSLKPKLNMVPTGLLNDTIKATVRIDRGRYGLRTDGEEHEGRLFYEEGIAAASRAFSQAASTTDPKIIMLVEEVFIEQELQFCSEEDSYSRSSLTQALQSFNDAFLCLEIVEDAAKYQAADNTWPHSPKYRIHSYPKDAYHLACIAHKTRLQNILRAPGINMIEKQVLEQRIGNMNSAQSVYILKQKKALSKSSKRKEKNEE